MMSVKMPCIWTPAKTLLVCLALTTSLTACGGGGGSSSTSSSSGSGGGTGTTSTNPTWTAGSFQNESNFDDRCAVPRTGTNPATGSAYPDQAGSTTWENHWLRAYSYRTYLWYDELPDLNPASYSVPTEYFDLLKTSATTASGKAKDEFHFSVPTDEYYESVTSGTSAGYGFRQSIVTATIPREARVIYVTPDSPADTAGLTRGMEILSVDGVSVLTGSSQADIDTLNAGLFPEGLNETHTFEFRDTDGVESTISLTSATVTTVPVGVSKVIEQGDAKIGYILFSTFGTSIAEEAIVTAIQDMKDAGIDDLVLDLRYNGGGFLDISAELAYMIAGPTATAGANFETLQFNNKYTTTNPVTGAALTPTPFHSTAQGFSVDDGTALPTLDLNRLFVLTTGSTCSASEALINGLRGVDIDVNLIGGNTCGKPYGFYGIDNCGETYFTVQFQGVNNKGFGDFADGFSAEVDPADVIDDSIPGCIAEDDYLNELGDENEGQLQTALSVIENGTCPAAPVTTKIAKQGEAAFEDQSTSLLNDPRVKRRLFLEQNSLYRNQAPSREAQ